MIHRHRVPLFIFQSFLFAFHALAHSCSSHDSVVSAVPILGCLRRLLLSLFVKLDYAPKCGVAWFIMKNFLSWILLRIILWLVVHHANTHQDGQSVMNLPPVETYPSSMLSSAFIELPSHPDMHLIACSKRLIVVSSMFFSMDSSQLVKSNRKKKCIGIINDVHHPYSCGEVHIWTSK